MYISDLQLHGFKSFAHKTHVKFDSGITAIVGPNGCGKSNIVDAMRWVLGEQRPSLLRSSAMSNVIFNGTAKKKALGLAEVSLTFVNDKGILPVEYSELTITRRLYRSGDSEYLINNTACRLKDIMELFMDTGMSSDAYSVIELKMVEEILNDRNNDRRRLFEEAAGVTRYKDKRKQTLRKLDETLKDLQRLEDILVEVRKKVSSLEKQAEKAAKAKTFKSELVTLDKAYNLHQYVAIEEELDPLKKRINNAEKEKKEIAKKLENLEQREEKSRTELLEKERAEAEARRHVSQLHSGIREMETQVQILEEKISNEEGFIQQHKKDIEQSRKDLEDLEKLKQASSRKLEGFSDELKQSESSLDESKERFTELQQQYSKVRHELFELEISVSSISQKLSAVQSNRIKLESKLENSEDDRERIRNEIEDLEKLISESNKTLQSEKKRLESLTSDLENRENDLQLVMEQRDSLSEKREEFRDEIRSLQSKADSVRSEMELMQSLAESNDALPSSVAWLTENHSGDFKTLAPVGKLLQTDEDHAAPLEIALGDAVHYLVVETMDDAIKASDLLKQENKGRATFIPLKELKNSYKVESESILQFVDVDKKFKPVAELLLGSVLFADTTEQAVKLISKGGTSAVSSGGDLITSDKILKSGSKDKKAGIRLGLKDKLDKLEKKLGKIQDDQKNKQEELEAILKTIQDLNPGQIRNEISELQQNRRNADQSVSRLQSTIQVYEKNVSELKSRKESISSTEGEAREKLESLSPEQNELQDKIEELNKKQEEKKKELQKLEDERAIAQNRYNDAQLKHQDVKNKAGNLEKEIRRAEEGIDTLNSRLESRKELMKQSDEKITSYKDTIVETKNKLAKAKEQKVTADNKLSEAEEASSRQRGVINEIDKELKELRRNKEVNMELVHHLTMAREKFEMQAESLSEYVWETYGILMNQLEEELPEDTTPEEAKKRIAELKQKLNRIGEVNPLAIEEFEEEKERLDFYEEQIQDLQKAEQELRQTIDEINQTATERFNETFKEIRENFKSVFHTLFKEDDNCDLLLEENVEDPLEAKIEIVANPRGKRPSSINQLSGGEKTLTAIALLFAIYLVKPSPFCVLDEVDAPLDDANIERFASMIRQFADETQFIIITHNKKTMSKAEMMYGVTMPETGVSRLVGVKLDEVAEV